MRTTKLLKNIRNYLNGDVPETWLKKGITDRRAGPASTQEILSVYNSATRHGTTPQQLGNVLSIDQYIIKVGNTKVSGSGLSGKYDICMWDTVDNIIKVLPDFEKGDRVFTDEDGNLERIIGRF